MTIDTNFLERCTLTLAKALELLDKADKEELEYDLYRSACVKEFEIILEQAGKLLKKCLRPYFSSSKQADRLYFTDIFHHAANHGLITVVEAERWLQYRDNRNATAHDYGVNYAEETLELLPQFIEDTNSMIAVFRNCDA